MGLLQTSGTYYFKTETYGMLYCAEISEFEHNLHKEISEIEFFDTPTVNQTYPQIQPLLVKEVLKRGFC